MGYDRGPVEYFPVNNQSLFEPLGHIPQVPQTYSYFEETYGAVNEHGLGIGETTCSCVRFGTTSHR